jgi:hypothetical protein
LKVLQLKANLLHSVAGQRMLELNQVQSQKRPSRYHLRLLNQLFKLRKRFKN